MTIDRPGRALGLKLLLIGAIVVLLGVPLGFVSLLSWERSQRANAAIAEVGEISGGEQVLRGPFLAVPYTQPVTVLRDENGRRVSREEMRERHLFISATSLDYELGHQVEVRHRAIYEVPVYAAQIAARGRFVMPEIAGLLPDDATPDLTAVRMVVAVNDLRAIARPLEVRLDGARTPLEFEPGTPFDTDTWRGVRADIGRVDPGREIAFELNLHLTGASALRLTASGKETTAVLRSDWPHPGFHGGFLPETRTISAEGFEAVWRVPYLARGVPAAFTSESGGHTMLDAQSFGVRLVTPGDGYQQVARSLKYALFFIGLLMVLIFLIEARSGQRIHPAQYLMLGMAQVVFYLLLLALSEHAANAVAYGVAMAATVGLSGTYAASAFHSRRLGIATAVAMGVVYAMQYVLILVEDYALLIGAVLGFAGLAAAMLLTRRIDWYERLPVERPAGAAAEG